MINKYIMKMFKLKTKKYPQFFYIINKKVTMSISKLGKVQKN